MCVVFANDWWAVLIGGLIGWGLAYWTVQKEQRRKKREANND